VEQFYAILLGSTGQCPLFPKRVGGTVQFYNVDVGGILYTTVLTRFDEDEELVVSLHLLQFLDFLQDDIVHAVLVLAENALGLDTDYHVFFVISL
jgi:hypothetical protein